MSFFDKLLEDPLKTAAIGTALYFGAPAVMGAMGSSGGAAALGGAEAAGGLSAAELAGAGTDQALVNSMGESVVNPNAGGLLGSMPNFKEVASYAKPVSESLMAANAAKGLLSTPQKQLQSQVPQGSGNSSQLLAQLYQPYQMQPRQKTNWG